MKTKCKKCGKEGAVCIACGKCWECCGDKCSAVHNEELKTLKDLLNPASIPGATSFKIERMILNGAKDDLKQEAIKWVKFLESDSFYDEVQNFQFSDPYDIVPFIKLFFNITEEDLDGKL